MITPTTDPAITTAEDIFPTGAYVIRNKATLKVIHIKRSDVAAGSSEIIAHDRDEINHRDQQIWWVERLPEDVDHDCGSGTVYSVTNTAGGLSLDVQSFSPQSGSGVHAWGMHGGYEQKWLLQPVQGGSGEDNERSIITFLSGHLLQLKDPKPQSGTELELGVAIPKSLKQCWEFLNPVVAVPAGWIQIINVGSGNILSQAYPTSPPNLVPAQDTSQESPRYRESWKTHWTIVQPSTHHSQALESHSTWIMKNRCTGTRLVRSTQPYNSGHKTSVNAMMNHTFINVGQNERWILDLESDNAWKIRNQEDWSYLEETAVRIGKGTEVACLDQRFKRGESQKKWLFKKVVHA